LQPAPRLDRIRRLQTIHTPVTDAPRRDPSSGAYPSSGK
jgi:hypothetical protein